MSIRKACAILIVLALFPVFFASSASDDSNLSNIDNVQESAEDITQGGETADSLFYKEGYEEDKNIVKKITGEMSDSRKMGIGALIVLIGSVLYAGFNWDEESTL